MGLLTREVFFIILSKIWQRQAIKTKFGISSKEELSAPFPANQLVFVLTVKVHCDDHGSERNEVTGLRFIRKHEPEANPFPLPESGGDQ